MKRFLVYTACLLFPVCAHAIQIDNPKVVIQARPGHRAEVRITVSNPDPAPATVRVYLQDFEYNDPHIGPKKFMPAGTSDRSIAAIVAYEPNLFTVPAKGTQVVRVSIMPNEDINTALCGVLFFESGLLNGSVDGQNGGVLAKLGALIYLEPTRQQREVTFSGTRGEKGRKIKVDVLNSGNTYAHLSMSYYVMDNNSAVVYRGVISQDRYLMPGDKDELPIVIDEKLTPGDYFMVVNAAIEGGGSGIHEIEFSLASDGTVTANSGQ